MMYTGFIVVLVIGFLLIIAAKVLIMLAVGNDAKALGVKDRVIWMVLTFFVPTAAIVYACIRKDLEKEFPKQCTKCNQYVPSNQYQCSHCGSAALVPCEHVQAKQLKKSSAGLTIAGAIAMSLAVLLFYVGYFGLLIGMLNDSRFNEDIFDDYGYYDYDEDDPFDFYDDYFDDYEDYFNDFDD